MGATSLPAAAKRGAISSPPSSPARASDWLRLSRFPRASRHAWVISIPKKVIPTSVRRSRLRRLVREAVRALGAVPPRDEMWRFSVKVNPPQKIKTAEVTGIVEKLIGSK